jgi:DNA helicase-2/ATP-dependent DNA helicase PcrA
MAWLRLILNPADAMAFRRAVERPRRGVGEVLQSAIAVNAAARGGNIMAAARAVSSSSLGTAKSRAGLGVMCELVEYWAAENAGRYPGDLIRDVIERSGLREFYAGAGGPENISAVENLYEVVNAASSYASGELREFVEASTLEAVTADKAEQDLLTIATLHGAKGLEWRGVWMAGLEDGLLPNTRALDEEGGEDEERRLAYVGMTRAKMLLTLTVVASRYMNGTRTSPQVSRFLDRAAAHYLFADHTSADGGRAARMARSGGRASFGGTGGGRPIPNFGAQIPVSSKFPRHP